MKTEVLPNMDEEDKQLMENILASGHIKHKFAVRLQTVLNRSEGKSSNDIASFLGPVLDLFDRKVIGWALSADRETVHTTIPALEMAFKNRAAQDGLLFHSDRGIQYCAKSFRKILRERCPSVHQSMSRKGNCWDNACAESFFKTLKTELETLDGKHSVASVRLSVFMYVQNCTTFPAYRKI